MRKFLFMIVGISCVLLLSSTLFSCSSMQKKKDQEDCGDIKDQARRFVQKMLAEPDDVEEILLSENCIDCSEYYELFKKENESSFSTIRSLKLIVDIKCKISDDIKIYYIRTPNDTNGIYHLTVYLDNYDTKKGLYEQNENLMLWQFIFEIVNPKKIKFLRFVSEI